MKKILSILLALCMALTPTLAFGAGSPTIKTLIKTPPAITYELAEYDEAIDLWTEVMSDENMMSALMEIFGGTEFQLDEMLYIKIDKPYTKTAWSFMRQYTKEDTIVSILYGESIYVLTGTVVNQKVIFDFTDVAVGEYDMLIVANPVDGQ